MKYLLNYLPTSKPRQDFTRGHACELNEEANLAICAKIRGTLEKQPHLRTSYRIEDLARETGILPSRLSAYIKFNLGLSFTAYINRLRVWHCQYLMQTPGGHSVSLTSLARHCGFTSRDNLSRAFKKFTGLTPSEYAKSQFVKGSKLRVVAVKTSQPDENGGAGKKGLLSKFASDEETGCANITGVGLPGVYESPEFVSRTTAKTATWIAGGEATGA
jgi:AraC-like DNA-binding protein